MPMSADEARAVLSRAGERMKAGLYHPEAEALFHWYIARSCSFRCPYCNVHLGPLARTPLDPAGALRSWQRCAEELGSVQICCTGAEPMCREEEAALMGRVAQRHILDINSNMSFPLARLEHFPDPTRIFFTTSYHPVTAPGRMQPLDDFRRSINAVRERGYRVTGVSSVAFPPLIPLLAETRRAVEADGHYFSVHLFRGSWEGVAYPEGYTDGELDAIAEVVGGHPGVASVEPKPMQGRACWAGCRYLLITSDGRAHRCPGTLEGPSLGSFYEGSVSVSSSPTPCDSPFPCACTELWPYHATDEESAAAALLAEPA